MAQIGRLRDEMTKARSEYKAARERLTELEYDVSRLENEYQTAMSAYADALEKERSLGLARQAEAAASGEYLEPGDDFERIVYRAGDRFNAQQRVEARRLLEKMGPLAIEPLLALIDREGRRRNRRLHILGSTAVAFTLAIFAEMCIFPGTLAEGTPIHWLMLVALLSLWPISRAVAIHTRAADALTRVEDLRVVGPLAESLSLGDLHAQRAVSLALQRLLPRMHSSDAHLLTTVQLDSLYQALNGIDVDLIIVILGALEQIGDERALAAVERIAEGRTWAAQFPRVQDAARECLPALADRTLADRPGRTLLRASMAGAEEPYLVRPAASGEDADPAVLVRPAVEMPEA